MEDRQAKKVLRFSNVLDRAVESMVWIPGRSLRVRNFAQIRRSDDLPNHVDGVLGDRIERCH